MERKTVTLGVVGVCGSGKTTLVEGLRALGFQTRHIAQEHSYAPDMWQQLIDPDYLIYLQVSYPLTLERKNFQWKKGEYKKQLERLSHAYQHADLVIETDALEPQEVLTRVLRYLQAPT